MTPPWSAAEPGHTEDVWIRSAPWSRLGTVDLDVVAARYERVVLVVPHPDDETLALGGFLAELAARGLPIDILLVTDGEGSHPHSPALSQEVLARLRRDEMHAALNVLGVRESVHRVALPDSGVAARADALDRVLADLVNDSVATLVLAPWPEDGHSDHDAAGRSARALAAARGTDVAFYPVWMWHWCAPTAFDWTDAVLVVPSADALHRKEKALVCYVSQTSALALPPGRDPVLSGEMLARARRTVETIFDPQGVLPRAAEGAGRTPAAPFDAMFEGTLDPWGVESRWYERRRRAVIEAMLPSQSLGRVLDLGCSTGVLTRALAARAHTVLAIDQSHRALEIARARTPDGMAIEWRRGELPDALDRVDAVFDTIVVSEIAYFLDGRNLLGLLAALQDRLAAGGVVLVANWQRPTRDIPLDGQLVDRQVAAAFHTVATYTDDDVVARVCVAADPGRAS